MTFSDIVEAVKNRLNLRSQDATDRIGATINDRYKRVTSSIGLNVTRRTTVQKTVTIGISSVIFSGVEKVISVQYRATTPYKTLKEVAIDELRAKQPATTGTPTTYAVLSMGSDTVTIEIDCIPQTAFTLYADGHINLSTLSGTQTPAFPESFHDILMHGALADEYRKLEKLNYAIDSEKLYESRLSDLRMWIAMSIAKDNYQGKTSEASTLRSTGSGSGSGSINGATSYTQTGLETFDRTGQPIGFRAPFAVAVGSEPVDNLLIEEAGLELTDSTTNNATNLHHGFTPKSPGDATKFLNGAAIPAWALVKDTDLSLTDNLTNNTSSVKHGFAPKIPNDGTKFLSGLGTYTTPVPNQIPNPITQDILFSASNTYDIGTFIGNNKPRDIFTSRNASIGVDLTVFGDISVNGALSSGSAIVFGGLSVSGIINADAGQIGFPNLQNPSSSANVLDDYEEGTWTPVLGGATGTSGQTYTTQVGRYVKIGKMVFVQWYLQLSNIGTVSGSGEIQGLPFTSENTANLYTAASLNWSNALSNFVYITLQYPPNSTNATIVGITGSSQTLLAINVGNFGNTSGFIGSMVYRAAA